MFPNAGSEIYRNEAGEVTGWDNGAHDDGPYDPDDYLPQDDDDDDDDEDDDRLPTISFDDKGGFVVHLPGGSVTTYPTLTEAKAAISAHLDADEDDEPEPQEPDDGETSWQEYGREEAYAEAEMARYDDDPSPYDGTYSEM
jgi:hypothetical protein